MFANNMFSFLMLGQFGKLTPKKLAKYENDIQWQNTFVNYMNIMIDMFEWKNLPDSCDYRYLEIALINSGMAGLFDDSSMGWLSLPCMGESNLNIYGYYEYLNAYGMNGYNKRFKAYIPHADNTNVKGFPIYDNPMRYPMIFFIVQATDRIMNAMRAIDVSAMKLKNPYFVTCEEAQANSIREVLRKVDNNEQIVITSKALNPDAFQILPTKQDSNSVMTLWQHYYNLDTYIRTMIGIENNANPDKKERLLVDEVNSNSEVTMINANLRLQQRKQFCEEFNAYTGMNIDVDLRYKKEGEEVEGLLKTLSSNREESNGLDMGKRESNV